MTHDIHRQRHPGRRCRGWSICPRGHGRDYFGPNGSLRRDVSTPGALPWICRGMIRQVSAQLLWTMPTTCRRVGSRRTGLTPGDEAPRIEVQLHGPEPPARLCAARKMPLGQRQKERRLVLRDRPAWRSVRQDRQERIPHGDVFRRLDLFRPAGGRHAADLDQVILQGYGAGPAGIDTGQCLRALGDQVSRRIRFRGGRPRGTGGGVTPMRRSAGRGCVCRSRRRARWRWPGRWAGRPVRRLRRRGR